MSTLVGTSGLKVVSEHRVLIIDGVAHQWTAFLDKDTGTREGVSASCLVLQWLELPHVFERPERYDIAILREGGLTCLTCLANFDPCISIRK